MPASHTRKWLLYLSIPCVCLAMPALTPAQNAPAAVPTPTSQMQVSDIPAGQQHLTPAQMPPKDPTVSFQNGSLTVVAENSTLSAILHAVEKTAGIKLQGTPPEDRIFGKFGPGSPRDVLTQLFSGAHIDYILQGNNNPNSVQSIIINNRGSLNADMFTRVPSQPAGTNSLSQPNVINSATAGGQEPENTNGYSSATDQTGPEENGYQPGQVPPPPSQQQLLDRLHQMQNVPQSPVHQQEPQ